MGDGFRHYALLALIALLLGVFIGTGGVDVILDVIGGLRLPR